LRLCALFTGGKDSTYSLHLAVVSGHNVECLAAIKPAKSDSMLYHVPGIDLLDIYEKALGIPLYVYDGTFNEEKDLEDLLKIVKKEFRVEGVSVGAIESDYQFIRFYRVLKKLGMSMFAPLWHKDQESYMRLLPRQGFRYTIIKISTYGLPMDFLGSIIDEEATERIIMLSKRYGFNPAFEGGEAETMVLDAPLMKCRINVKGNIIVVSELEGYYSIYDKDCSEKVPFTSG
jgi:ABC transporter with metal-binding/Fe-S-binding domain ATP-binding protein